MQPRLQLMLTRAGRVGNKKAVVGRAAGGMALLVAAVLLMWTQTTNPFLYFQF